MVLTNDLIVELTLPSAEVKSLALELGWVNQGYRGFGTITADSYNKSGSCNMDVACLDAGDSWREEMRAVGVISTGGSTFCTGSLVNDTAGDRKMYFMTANHCTITSGNAASLVVYWNFQNSFCRTPGSTASGQAGDGSLTQFHTGSFFRAANAPSDFTLVELDDPAVTAYNHYWAGWNRATGDFTCTAGAPCAGIHHPSTDEKRITYVIVNTATTSYNATASPGDGTHVWAKWATDPPGPFTVPGVTEGGSSGSPLYDANGRFIGQLHGGPSSCGATGNNLSDYYGRFSVSWTGGGTSSTRLSNWLDAGGTGATTTNGLDTAGGGGNTAPSVSITSPANGSSAAVGASVSFTGTATDTQDGTLTGSLSWSSSINGAIGSGGSFSTSTLSAGTHTITASVTDSGSLVGSASISITITAGVTPLTNGVPVTGLSGAAASSKMYSLAVPAGATNLSFTTSGGTGDADLYVKFGSQPTTTGARLRLRVGHHHRVLPFATPSTGTYYALVYGYAAYSGVSLDRQLHHLGWSGHRHLLLGRRPGRPSRRVHRNLQCRRLPQLHRQHHLFSARRRLLRRHPVQERGLLRHLLHPGYRHHHLGHLRLKRGTVSGTTPSRPTAPARSTCRSAFGGSTAIATGDFEAAAATSGVASMSDSCLRRHLLHRRPLGRRPHRGQQDRNHPVQGLL